MCSKKKSSIINIYLLIYLGVFFINPTFAIEEANYCKPNLSYESKFDSYEGLSTDPQKKLDKIVNTLAHASDIYCGMKVDILVKDGPRDLVIAEDFSKWNRSNPHIRIQYLTPSYTMLIRSNNNIELHNQNFGNEIKYTTFTISEKENVPKAVYEFWMDQKEFMLQKLINELNQYQEAQDYLNKLIAKYQGTFSDFVTTIESDRETLISTSPNPNWNPFYKKIPENEQGHLVLYKKEIPIKLQKGDELTFIAKGKIFTRDDQFSPKGFPDRYPRRFTKIRQDQPYGKLFMKIDDEKYVVGDGATFTVEKPGSLSLITNIANNDSNWEGAFEVWIYLNKRLITPISKKGYLSQIDANNTDKFYFTPDYKLLAVTNKQEIQLFETETGNLLKSYPIENTNIQDLIFLEYDPVFVTVNEEGKVLFREVRSGKIIKNVFLNERKIAQVDFSRDAKYLGTIPVIPNDSYSTNKDEGKNITIYDLEKEITQQGKGAIQLLQSHEDLVSMVKFSPIDDVFISGDQSGGLHLWDTKSWRPFFKTQIPNEMIKDVFFDKNAFIILIQTTKFSYAPPETGGRTIISTDYYHLLDTKTGKFLNIQSSNSSGINTVPNIRTGDTLLYMSSNGKYMIISNRKSELHLWETNKY